MLAGKDALILFPERDILGDVIAWLPQAVRFGKLHDCRPDLTGVFTLAFPGVAVGTNEKELT